MFKNDGYIIYKNFFNEKTVNDIKLSARFVFIKQLLNKGIIKNSADINDENELELFVELFNKDFESFINCGKTCQHLINLHRLCVDQKVINEIKNLGLYVPTICTRPVLFFNHKDVSKHNNIYKTPPHQDWRSMQGSLNSLVMWLPLVDVPKELGPIEIIPGSHKFGLKESIKDDGFFRYIPDVKEDFVPVELSIGDVVFFSSFLIHRSGDNVSNNLRWSCHFRYNDIMEQTFIDRNYPNPYIYKPQQDLITDEFPSINDIDSIFT